MYFVYILKCSDNSLYTGITSDLERRIKEHDCYKKRIRNKKNDKIKKTKIDFWKKILKLTFLNEKRIIW